MINHIVVSSVKKVEQIAKTVTKYIPFVMGGIGGLSTIGRRRRQPGQRRYLSSTHRICTYKWNGNLSNEDR